MENKNTYKELKTDVELLTAALLQVRVHVVATPPYDPDELVDCGGPIVAYSPVSVRIGSVRYMRRHHSFRITE